MEPIICTNYEDALRGTQKGRLLTYLQLRPTGASKLEIIRDLHILNVGARIQELREQGHPIYTHMVTVGDKRFARYLLALDGQQRLAL